MRNFFTDKEMNRVEEIYHLIDDIHIDEGEREMLMSEVDDICEKRGMVIVWDQ